MHTCPPLIMRACAMRVADRSMSASGDTTTGFLPPSSRVTGTRCCAAACCTSAPTDGEPVKNRWSNGSVETAASIVALGEGSLVGTLYSDDRETTVAAIAALSPWLGRLVLGTEKLAGAALSPGCVFPVCNHGGPGRAGDGAELGGRSGLSFYLQRTTLQGGGADLSRLLGTPAGDG